MSSRTQDLLQRLEALIREEARLQLEQFESQWMQPLSDRIRAGKALEGLRVTGINARTGRIVLTCDRNDSKFREGDYLFLHRGSPFSDCLEYVRANILLNQNGVVHRLL